eukprot:9471409-Pyramimonas_sp.AAC.1
MSSSVELPMGPRGAAALGGGERMRAVPLGPSMELRMGPRSAVLRVEMPNWVCGTHTGGPTGGFGGAPYGATKRCA